MSSSNLLFSRACEVVVGPRGQDGRSFKVRTQFAIEKTGSSSSNKGKILLFNLSQDSRSFLEQKGLVVRLRAGYQDILEDVFFGEISRPTNARQASEIITTLESGTGELALNQAHVEISLSPGGTVRQVLNSILASFGSEDSEFAQGIIKGIENKAFSKGFAFSGPAKEALDQIAENQGLEWSIQDGSLQVIPKDENTGETAVLLSKETGLIGWPSKSETGLVANSLLNPKLKPGRLIKVRSKQLSGILDSLKGGVVAEGLEEGEAVFKITKVTHSGDTREGPWFSKIEADVVAKGE